MKKMTWLIAAAMGIMLALSACGSKKESTAAGSAQPVMTETTEEETNPDNGLPLSKQPDPTAPVLASIVVYAPDDSGKMECIMDASSELSGQNVVDLLTSYGTLADGVTFVSLDTSDSGETMAAGPGASSDDEVKVQTGVLTLQNFQSADGVDESAAKQAVIDTFKENYELEDVTLVLK